MLSDSLFFLCFLASLLLIAWPLGNYMARVFVMERTWADPVFSPIEKIIYKFSGISPEKEMNWKEYAQALLLFHGAGLTVTYLIQRVQNQFPLNPERFSGISPWDMAFNTAVSFLTNTNWQSYVPEATMSYFTQMTVLSVQNFLSAAVGSMCGDGIDSGAYPQENETYWKFLG